MKWLGRFTFTFLALAFLLVYSVMTTPGMPLWRVVLMYCGAAALLSFAVVAARQRHAK